MNETTTEKQHDWCYYIDGGQVPDPDHGYVPSMVKRNEAGHAPLTGNGAYAKPWYWGRTYGEAQANCAKYNEEIGVSPAEAAMIVLSSIAASAGVRPLAGGLSI
jgi:hypothetical protein